MKNAVKVFLSEFLLKIIPLWVYKILVPRKVTSIFYHVVSDDQLPHIENIYPVISTLQFRRGLEYLSRHYDFVGYEEIESSYKHGAELPRRAVHLTFDDGFIECYSVVRPILLEYGIPASFFITTDFIGNEVFFSANLRSVIIDKFIKSNKFDSMKLIETVSSLLGVNNGTKENLIKEIKDISKQDHEILNRLSDVFKIDAQEYLNRMPIYLDEEMILEMHSEGFTIGSHTRSHRKLGLINEKIMEEEIVESSKIIKKLTGQRTVPFAFPNSGHGVNRDKLAEIRKHTPELGLIFDSKGFNQDVDFIINRVWGEHRKFIKDKTHHRMNSILHNAYQEAFFIQISNLLKGKIST